MLGYKSRTASFDTDCTNAFTELCPAELPVVGGQDIVPALNEQAKYASFRLGCKEIHGPNFPWVAGEENPQHKKIEGYRHLDQYWNAHSMIGTFGAQLIAGLPKVTEYRYMAYKGMEPDMHPYGGLYHTMNWKEEPVSTGVIEVCLVEDINLVIVGGLAFDFCVKETILQFLDAGIEVIVNMEATRAVFPENIPAVCDELRKAGATIIFNTSELDDLIDDDTANHVLTKEQSNEPNTTFDEHFQGD